MRLLASEPPTWGNLFHGSPRPLGDFRKFTVKEEIAGDLVRIRVVRSMCLHKTARMSLTYVCSRVRLSCQKRCSRRPEAEPQSRRPNQFCFIAVSLLVVSVTQSELALPVPSFIGKRCDYTFGFHVSQQGDKGCINHRCLHVSLAHALCTPGFAAAEEAEEADSGSTITSPGSCTAGIATTVTATQLTAQIAIAVSNGAAIDAGQTPGPTASGFGGRDGKAAVAIPGESAVECQVAEVAVTAATAFEGGAERRGCRSRSTARSSGGVANFRGGGAGGTRFGGGGGGRR